MDDGRRQPAVTARDGSRKGTALLLQLAFTMMAFGLLCLWSSSQPGQDYLGARMECMLDDDFAAYKSGHCGTILVHLEENHPLTPTPRIYPGITVSSDSPWPGAPPETGSTDHLIFARDVVAEPGFSEGGSALLQNTELTAAQRCLSLNVYWEARNQPYAGQLAVAQVTMNRVRDRRFPDDVCQVVYDHKQFSWYWDGKADRPRDPRAWDTAVAVASAAIAGSGNSELEGVTHYHAVYVQPYWKDHMRHIATIGDHVFYSESAVGQTLRAALEAD